jgi:hypothetical protein
MVQRIEGFTQNLSDAYASARDAVKNHPKTALLAGAALAGAAAYAIDPALFALKSTNFGWIYNETSPTLLGCAVNLISWPSNEPSHSMGTISKCYSSYVATVFSTVAGGALGKFLFTTVSGVVGGGIVGASGGIIAAAKYFEVI